MDTTGNKVFDYTVTGSSASSIATGDILDGNVDGWYTIIMRTIADAATTLPQLRFNGDSGANYGRLGIAAAGATMGSDAATGEAGFYVGYGIAASPTAMTVTTVYAKSGSVRTFNTVRIDAVNGTTITEVVPECGVWNNTADNIVSMSFVCASAVMAVGTRVIILKGNNLSVGTSPGNTGAWRRVGTSVLGSSASSVTFTSLTGNTAVLYYWSSQSKGTAGDDTVRVRLNGDTGTNFGYQVANATGSSGSGIQGAYAKMVTVYGRSAYGIFQEGLLFAQAGFTRLCVSNAADGINGTTVAALNVGATSWNNTADEITSISFMNDGAGAIDTGSQFDLYALYV